MRPSDTSYSGDPFNRITVTNRTVQKYFEKVIVTQFEKVTQFKYLGTSITYDKDLSVEINNRIMSATRSYCGLKKQLKSHLLSTQTEIKLYKTLIRPVLMYGCESWSLTKNEENKIILFERKILRKIYGPTNDNAVWCIRYNQELY
jgi:hypothetical protein